MKLLLTAALLFVAIPATASAHFASPAPSVVPSPAATPAVFAGPKGWKHTTFPMPEKPPLTRITDQWSSRGTFEFMNLGIAPSGGLDLVPYAAAMETELRKNGFASNLVSQSHPVCGTRPGWIFRYTHDKVAITQVVALSGIASYIATYGHPVSKKDSPVSLAVLDALCVPLQTGLTNEVPFTPPAGWRRVDPAVMSIPQSMLELFQGVWIGKPSPGAGAPVVMLMKAPGSTAGLTIEQQANAMLTGLQNIFPLTKRASAAQNICEHYDGWRVSLDGAVNQQPVDMEVTMLPFEHTSYYAIYMHSKALAADPVASNSLNSICPPEPTQSS